MESFVWGKHFLTGVKTVDEQHHHLINILNRFGTTLAENKILNEHVQTIFEELADYAQYHFKEEEGLMQQLKLDPRYTEQHIGEHNLFFNDVKALMANIQPGKAETIHAVLDFLIQWVAYHILGSDQKMARQMASIKKGMIPAEAFLEEEKKEGAPTEALLTAVNNLYRQVSQRNRELIELNLSLEKKIAERTIQLREANQHLEKLALTDSLTGLPNRRFAMNQLKLLWKKSQQDSKHLSCMMIDADGFKHINDTYGHDAGDALLIRLANELKYSVRNDDIVCRLGGDEFFIICPETALDGALYLAEQLRSKIADLEIKVGNGFWAGSISIGVAWNHNGLNRIEELIKTADEGVYLAKSNGKNCVKTRQTV